MKANEAVRKIMEAQNMGVTQMAGRMGSDIKPRLITDRLAQKNISVSILTDLLRVLDYKVVIVPRSTRLPDGGYEVE